MLALPDMSKYVVFAIWNECLAGEYLVHTTFGYSGPGGLSFHFSNRIIVSIQFSTCSILCGNYIPFLLLGSWTSGKQEMCAPIWGARTATGRHRTSIACRVLAWQNLFVCIVSCSMFFLLNQTFSLVLLMPEILHHPGCMKPCNQWDKLPINWCRISAIKSTTVDPVSVMLRIAVLDEKPWHLKRKKESKWLRLLGRFGVFGAKKGVVDMGRFTVPIMSRNCVVSSDGAALQIKHWVAGRGRFERNIRDTRYM